MRLKVPNDKIMGGDTYETSISMEPWEHDPSNRPDLSKRIVLSRNFYAPDIIMGYDFMMSNAIGAPPQRAKLV